MKSSFYNNQSLTNSLLNMVFCLSTIVLTTRKFRYNIKSFYLFINLLYIDYNKPETI